MTHQIWVDMFVLTLPVAEKILRSILVYLFLLVGLRLAGKRELAQLNAFDLIVLLTLSNTVQNAIIGDDNTVVGGAIGAATLLALNYCVVRLVHRNHRLLELLQGKPDVLIEHGKVRPDRLEREMISPEELRDAAHRQGISSLKDVDTSILEAGGTISFLEKTPTHEDQRHSQLMDRLEQMGAQLAALRRRAAPANGAPPAPLRRRGDPAALSARPLIFG